MRSAQRRWGHIDGVLAFSFGVVRVMPLLSDAQFASTGFWLAAPAPLPGTAGTELDRLRLHSALGALTAVIHCRTRECDAHVRQRIGNYVNGRLGLTAEEARAAIIGLTTNAVGNAAFFRRVFVDSAGPLERKYALTFRRAAYTVEIAGSDRNSTAQRNAYLAGICPTYDWPATPPHDNYMTLHSACSGGSAMARHHRVVARNVVLAINSSDPVTPPMLQARWTRYLRHAVVRRYSIYAHTLTSASAVARFFARKGIP